jgi:small conductance mechanosensitive channel
LDKPLDELGQVRTTVIDLAIRFGPRLLVAVLIIVVGVVVARAVGKATERSVAHLDVEPVVRTLLVRLMRVVVLGLFGIVALQNLGVELLPLIAGLSVAGAGVALATQGVLSNVVAGLTIVFTKPYRVGEYVAIVGVEGTVDVINLFATTLVHGDRSRVVIPNRKVVGEILHNYGRIRQAEVRVRVSYAADLNRVLATVRELARSNPKVLQDPPPAIGITALGESAIQITVQPWAKVADFGDVAGELNLAIVDAFRRLDIAIAVPCQEVRLIGDGRPAAN